MSKESKACFDNVSVFSFGGAVLLVCVWAGDVVSDTMITKISMETAVFTTPIGLHTFNFRVKKELNMFLKAEKDGFNIGFSMEEVYPSEFCEIINKDHLIFKTTNRRNCGTPNICINKL
jgi:hypothetical protein